MRVFVTGASSSPGYKLVKVLKMKGFDVYAQYFTHALEHEGFTTLQLNLIDFNRVLEVLNDVKPDMIIHTAALGDVDLCEVDKKYALLINYEATKLLAKYAFKKGSFFIYLSTDYVFDGERGLYREDDEPNPINYYGLTKLLGEVAVASILERYIIVRSSQIYGFGMGRRNFGRYVIEALSKGEKVRALVDQWLSPTLNTLLAEGIVELIEKNYVGLIHVAGERVSRYDFARAVARRFNFDEDLIEPITLKDVVFKARRPRDSSLETSRARRILHTNFHDLEYALNILYNEWLQLKQKEV